jgi:hypothetical protein
MKIYTLCSLLFFCFHLSAQDISGKWTGFLDQTKAAIGEEGYSDLWKKGLWKEGVPTCYLELDIEQKGTAIEGTNFCTVYLKGDYNASFKLIGKFENNQLKYTTTEKTAENILEGYSHGFCFNKVELTYSEADGMAFLEGKWVGWSGRDTKCAPADVKLKKKLIDEKTDKYQSREVLIKEELHTKDKEIIIELWDDNREDGDIVSVKLNDIWLEKNTPLFNEKKILKVQLTQKENTLTLFAENLGDIPPNTAALNVKYNGLSKKIILKSNMWTSEAIKIYLVD